jgi:hypothetical protein
MEKFCSDLTVIVVGSERQRLIREIIAYLDHAAIAFDVCEDIYSAAAEMAVCPAETNLLIVGCFSSLTAEKMRIFSLVSKGGKISFCCVIQKWFDHLQPMATAAARPGVFIINNIDEIEIVIKQCGGDTAVRQKTNGRDFASRIASLADNFFLTQAEHDALLGAPCNAAAENRTFTE